MNKLQVYIKLIIVGFYICTICEINAQTPISGELPDIAQPSPEAAALFKYMDYPLDHSTGVPNINIPIYEIKSGDLSVPISISYHAAGRMVYDKTGALGLGWSLIAGGRISRTIYDAPDDDDGRYKFPSPWKSAEDINQLGSLDDYYFLTGADNRREFEGNGFVEHNELYDVQYDLFSYSCGGNSGKFIFRDVNNTKVPVMLPKNALKVEKHSDNSGPYHFFDYLEITDNKGVLYRFGKSCKDGTTYYEKGSYPEQSYITSWMLTEIISADKMDTISFKYDSFTKTRETSFQEEVSKRLFTYGFGYHTSDNTTPPVTHANQEQISEQRLAEITFRGGKVKFIKNGDEIEKIQVIDNQGNIIKEIEFQKSHLDSAMYYSFGEGTKKLDSLIFKDKQHTIVEKFEFEYYPTQQFIMSTSQDFWGYHNGIEDNWLTPYHYTKFDGFYPNPASNRNPYLTATKCGVLKKITFPTGGSTEFIFELNKYKDANNQIKECGGLRLAQKIINDEEGNTQLITYKYGEQELGYGRLMAEPKPELMSYRVFRIDMIESHVGLVPPSRHNGHEETWVTCNVSPQYSFFMKSPIFYPEVTEYYGSEYENAGKTLYKYNVANGSTIGKFSPDITFNYWDKNTLTDIIQYKSRKENSSTVYDMVRSTHNEYNKTFDENENLDCLFVSRKVIVTPNQGVDDEILLDPAYDYHPLSIGYHLAGDSWESAWCRAVGVPPYEVFDYHISVGKTELSSTHVTDYTDNGALTTQTIYTYDSNNHLLKSTRTKTSKGEDLITNYYYPSDEPSITGLTTSQRSVLNQMESNNQLPVILQEQYKDSDKLSTLLVAYKNFGSGRMYPETVKQYKDNGVLEDKVEYLSYDSYGNVIEVAKTNGTHIVYAYGHNHQYPIAKIENTTSQQIMSIFNLSSIENLTSTAQANLLRNILPNAMVTTYEYAPLVGMTSMKDPSGHITYYEYDEFNRLKLVKDADGNILSENTYHYYNQN